MAPERSLFAGRPVWANVLLVFCAFMTFVYTPWDIFVKPVAEDQEVWLGLLLTGWWAKATAPLHWAIYAAFTWGLWKMRPWMRFWGTVWIVQIAIGMLVWNLTDARGSVLGGLAFYLPQADVHVEHLERAVGASWCEWKGSATYWDVALSSRRLAKVAWSYEDPTPAFAALRGHVSFYPARVACFVGGVRVAPQPGGFYGGWVTPEVVGPFKGEPGTEGW